MLVQSFSLRLTLTYLVLFLVSLSLLLGAFYATNILLPERSLRNQIRAEAEALEQVYIEDGQAALVAALATRAAAGGGSAFHVFEDRGGNPPFSNIPSWPAYSGRKWQILEADLYSNGSEYDRLAVMLDIGFPDGARMLVGRDAEHIEEIKDQIEPAAIWFFISAILLGIGGGVLISRAIGQRIDRISGAAMTVMNGDMAGRVPVDGSNDDFDKLSRNLNQMLERIETLVASVRRVSDNVAHELRTPLARMLADVEQLEAAGDGSAQPIVERIGDEARRLQRIFECLLRISRLEAGRYELATAEIDPAEIIEDLCDLYRPAVEELGGSLEGRTATSQAVHGDRDLLFQALSNLIDNAIKYGGSSPRITVVARNTGAKVCFEVVNDAPELDREELRRFDERFFRGSNSAGTAGEGLGLTLVAAIADSHFASFHIESEDNRVRASICVDGSTNLRVRGA